MLQTKTYSQRDPRWANKKLGNSIYTIGTSGCVVTSLANLLSYFGYADTPDVVNDKLKRVNGFIGGLVVWSAVSKVYRKVKWIYRYYSYNNIKVAWYVYGKHIPVIVKVDQSPAPGVQSHFVLYVGDRKLIDPWTGTIKSTGVYNAHGYVLYDRA
jgi:hypothetical protein